MLLFSNNLLNTPVVMWEGVLQVLPSSSSSHAKHTPILWPGATAKGPVVAETARLAQQTAAEIAALELFKLSQASETLYDPDAPPAMKASPSASGSEDGGGSTFGCHLFLHSCLLHFSCDASSNL